MLAPIILFTYNRLAHTRQVVESLMQNNLAKNSELFIFSDNYKTIHDKTRVSEVREYISRLETSYPHAFAKITIIFRDRNFGLADSIIDGVTDIISKYNKVIVLEDDIVVSSVFLDYMNMALNKYQDETKVWSINAWNFPMDGDNLEDCFFYRVPNCWGWATWSDRWRHYKRDIQWVVKNFNLNDIKYINLENYANYYRDFILNFEGKIKSWAIFNYLICYKHRGLNLTPSISYVKQIGFDGSGVHCGNEGDDIYNVKDLNTTLPVTFPKYIEESRIALTRIQNFHIALKKPLLVRVKNKVYKIIKKLVELDLIKKLKK